LNLVIADGGSKLVRFTVHDDFVDPVTGEWHPIMGGSTIKVISALARLGGDVDAVVPDARSGNTVYSVLISDANPAEVPPKPPEAGVVLIKVQSLNGDRQLAIGVTID
jgi:hypothetical protein